MSINLPIAGAAQPVPRPAAPLPVTAVRKRSPWGTFLLSYVSLFIYYLVWYVKINPGHS